MNEKMADVFYFDFADADLNTMDIIALLTYFCKRPISSFVISLLR